MKRILICIDCSIHSDIVAKKGIQLGKKLDAEISMITVLENKDLKLKSTSSAAYLTEKAKADAKRFLSSILDKFACPAVIFIEEGKPDEKIIKVARLLGVDFIVLGTHGEQGPIKAATGTIANEVIKKSKLPVLLIPVRRIEDN